MRRMTIAALVLFCGFCLFPGQLQFKLARHTLPNGLRLVLAEDHSSPLVSYAIYYNVGSRNEALGRTGFAHLFEHMMFQGSENVERNQHHLWLGRAGGNDNGSTNQERTNYFATVPANQLELALWLESDRMRSLKITAENFENQRSTVKEERKQSYDNQPYAEGRERLGELLFESLPYRHSVIGSMDDLNAAQLSDVQQFFDTYYAPNNAVLAIVGDFDPSAARALVEKYFATIPARVPPPPVEIREPERTAEKKLTVYDKFAAIPALFAAYAIPRRGDPDAYALQLLGSVLVSGEGSRLYQRLVREKQLAVSVSGGANPQRGAGAFAITIMLRPAADLRQAWETALEEIEKLKKTPVAVAELDKVKNRFHAQLLGRMETGLGRAMLLCEHELYDGDAGRINSELDRYLKVTPADLQRVCNRYFTAANCNLVTVLPQAKKPDESFRKTAPFNASQQPFTLPEFRKKTLANGVEILVRPQPGFPRVHLQFVFKGGAFYEPAGKQGISALLAQTLKSGTAALSQKQIQEQLDSLGATLTASTGPDDITVTVTSLKDFLPRVLDIAADVIQKPAFPEEEVKKEVEAYKGRVAQQRASPLFLASEMLYRQVFQNHPYARLSTPGGAPYVNTYQVLPTTDFLKAVAAADIAGYHRRFFVPNEAYVAVVGDIAPEEVFIQLEKRFGGWSRGTAIPLEAGEKPALPGKRIVHLVNRPGSIQSYILIGNLLFERSHADYVPLQVANKILGGGRHHGGGGTGRLFLNLREEKGWTYGCYSWIMSFARSGIFAINAEVRTEVTAGAVQEILKEVDRLQRGDASGDDLKYSKSFLTGILSLLMEGRGLLDGLAEVKVNGLAADYWNRYADAVGAVTFNQMLQAAQQYMAHKNAVVVVVGDAAKIRDGLKLLADEIVVYDTSGKRVE